MTVDLLEKSGFFINREKSLGVATQQREFFGLFVDSLFLSLSLLPHKVQQIEKICREAGVALALVALAERSSKNFRECGMGHSGDPFALGHYRCIQRPFLKESACTGGDLSTKIRLDEESISDLVWWASNVESSSGRPLSTVEPDLVIFSDTSLSGWGAVSNGVAAKGPWTDRNRSRHIKKTGAISSSFRPEIIHEFCISCFSEVDAGQQHGG